MSKKSKSQHQKPILPGQVHKIIGRHVLPDVMPFVLDLAKCRGNRLYDGLGKRYLLDCFSFIASNPIGFAHPGLKNKRFEAALLRAAKTKPSNSDLYTVEMAAFCQAFYRVALPPEFTHLFFVEGGTLAVENALKAAFDWKVRKNYGAGSTRELGTQILHFKEAFHGRSGYTLSLTNTADQRKTKYFPKFDWPRILNPKCTFPLEGENLRRTIALEEESLNQIEIAFKERAGDIAAILIEPIQGEGGDNHFRPEFHQALRRLADKHEAMLIYDEVQAGVGLTGKMWAYQHYGIVPDMVSFGKKLQVCGFMCGKRIDEIPDNVFQETQRINSTWGGNLVDMVRATRFLEIIEKEKLVQNAAKMGSLLLTGLYDLCRDFPNLLNNARGRGLMCALDAVTPELRDKLVVKIMEKGAVILKCGQKSIRFRPSLTFRREEVEEVLSIFRKAAGEVA